jgi:hypothetical protein
MGVVAVTNFPSNLALPGPPGLGLRLRVALSRARLDRALARDGGSVARRALAVRAGQLASPRGRAGVAASLERAFAAALGPHPPTSAVVPSPTAIRANCTAFLDLVDRLRSPEPVAAAGLARILVLLRDGSSALYLPARPELLTCELDRVHRALDGGGVSAAVPAAV